MNEIQKKHMMNEVKDEVARLYEMKNHSLSEILDHFHIKIEPYVSLITDYQCACMEVETKFRVLSSRLSVYGDLNPIETIKSRIKSPESIIRKLDRKNMPINIESIKDGLTDVAGVRVICSFVEDIYRLEKVFLEQDDITLVNRKDYIEQPKYNGYRSLHLIVTVPIFTETGKRFVNVEVQMRTIAMDFWASLEHKLRYKKDMPDDLLNSLSEELKICAEESAALDQRMEKVKNRIIHSNQMESEFRVRSE